MTFRLLLSSLTAIAIGAGLAFGASPADQQIAARQAEMKANGKAMEALVAILKGDTTYDPAFVKTNVEAMIAAKAAGEAARGWDAGSQRGTVETQAKPEIWTDAAGFANSAGLPPVTGLGLGTGTLRLASCGPGAGWRALLRIGTGGSGPGGP